MTTTTIIITNNNNNNNNNNDQCVISVINTLQFLPPYFEVGAYLLIGGLVLVE